MIGGKKVLGLIPARGGSKGVPRKNIRDVCGRPLLAWTIREASRSRYIDQLVLSSDDEEIGRIASSYGCDVPFVRPKELSQDDTPGIDPVIHALDLLPEFELVVLLQPTSPLRLASDVDGTLELSFASAFASCVSVVPVSQHPYWCFTSDAEHRMLPVVPDGTRHLRRQDLPPVYAVNGAVYVGQAAVLRAQRSFLGPHTRCFVMPESRSLDIDTEDDLELAEILLRKRQNLFPEGD